MSDDSRVLEGRSVLVIGGAGSLGVALVRRVLTGKAGLPAKVTIMSRGVRTAGRPLLDGGSPTRVELVSGDVRDPDAVGQAVRGADVVMHLAALRDIPVCEHEPAEAVLTNCLGAVNVVRAVRHSGYRAEVVLAASTAKACAPTSVMGMTKALEERVLIGASAAALEAGGSTRFAAVRFGNLLGTAGSVVPLFAEQIRRGGPVTVTEARMTRFVSSVDDAVDGLLDALRMARPGEVVVPRALAARVVDIAYALIGGRDIEIGFTGARPGERMHELLVSADECARTVERRHAFVIRPALPRLAEGYPVTADSATRLVRPYSSEDDVADRVAVTALLERAGLLLDERRRPQLGPGGVGGEPEHAEQAQIVIEA